MGHRGALIFAFVLVAGCGGSNDESALPVAGVDELLGPYQTAPYRAFNENLIRSVGEQCDASLREAFNAQPEPILADGRGGGRLMLIYAEPDGDTAECLVKIDRNGTPTVDSSGFSSGAGQNQPGPLEIFPSSGGSASGPEPWSYVHGSIGSEIGGVVISLADGTNVTASVGGGRFAAWWPGEAEPNRIRGFDSAGRQVADEPY